MLGFTERNLKSANQVLRYAHSRTSTKDHDKIFALANIFHYIIDIDIDYSIDVSTSMKTFYRHLVRKDLSIICFGSKMGVDGNPRYATTMDSYGLPSWTGAAGLHPTGTLADTTPDQNCDYTIDNHMRLHIKCRSYTIRLIKYNDLDVFEDDKRGKKAQRNYRRVITSMDDFYGDDERKALDWSQWCMLEATNCTPTHYYKPGDHVPFLSPILPLSLTEECDECVILGIVFDSVSPATFNDIVIGYTHNYLSPVASMSTDSSSYKIIGAILLKSFRLDEPRNSPQEYMDNMFDNLECETQEFYIK